MFAQQTYQECISDLEAFQSPFDFAPALFGDAHYAYCLADLDTIYAEEEEFDIDAAWDAECDAHFGVIPADEADEAQAAWDAAYQAHQELIAPNGHSTLISAIRMGALALLLALLFALPTFAQSPAGNAQAQWDFAWGQPVYGNQSYYGFYQPATPGGYGYGGYQSQSGYYGVQVAQQPITFGDALGINHRVGTAGQR